MQTTTLFDDEGGGGDGDGGIFRDRLTSPWNSRSLDSENLDTTGQAFSLKSSNDMGMKDGDAATSTTHRTTQTTNTNCAILLPHNSEGEADSSDSSSISTAALHLSGETKPIFRNASTSSIAPVPRLTLSAFKRPEHTVRLTKCDPSRLIEMEYDLHAPDCGILGHGAFACVRLAVRRRDGMKVAVKTIAKHEALRSRRLRIRGRTYLEEWEIHRRLIHNPFVVTLLDVFETNEEIQLITEYCEGGELFDAIQKKRNRAHCRSRGQYAEKEAALIAKQVLLALDDIHKRGIVHRDVKPENILLVSKDESCLRVKLCDFGIAKIVSAAEDGGPATFSTPPARARSFSFVGSDYYMAPEVIYGGRYDSAIDMYSFGVTLYILLCGFPPVFSGNDSDEVVFPTAYWKDVSAEAKDLTRRLLLPDTSKRISARDALAHNWIVGVRLDFGRSAMAIGPVLSKEDLFTLEMVRQCLQKSLGTPQARVSTLTRKRCYLEHSRGNTQPARKRRYDRRASATLMALADLYRGSAPAAAAAAAAATSTATVTALGSPSPRRERKRSYTGSTIAALSF